MREIIFLLIILETIPNQSVTWENMLLLPAFFVFFIVNSFQAHLPLVKILIKHPLSPSAKWTFTLEEGHDNFILNHLFLPLSTMTMNTQFKVTIYVFG